ncbi:MAG: SLATT domain-containing protein [Actinobacteria bacterium]|nr:SLATT domain-containing protein [Actinomycetota bacterium]
MSMDEAASLAKRTRGARVDRIELLELWRRQARRANIAHLRATDSLTWRNRALGGVAVVSATVTGSSLFGSVQSGHLAPGWRIAAAATAVLLAGVAALWRSLDYGSRITSHEQAGRDYGNAVRRIDRLMGEPASPALERAMSDLEHELAHIDERAINVPAGIWLWADWAVEEAEADPRLDPSTLGRGLLSRIRRTIRRMVFDVPVPPPARGAHRAARAERAAA